MEELRDKLEKYIERYGIGDSRVLAISQKLDIEICNAQREV